jgi:sulfatase modifying factor 1
MNNAMWLGLAMSIASMLWAQERVDSAIAQSLNLRVGVADLQSSSEKESARQQYQDRVRHALSEAGVLVVEREQLDKVFREIALQESGACEDAGCVARAGKLLGASHLLMGGVERNGGTYTFSVRLVEVESGQVVGSALADCQCEQATALQALPRSVVRSLRPQLGLGALVVSKDDARLSKKTGLELREGMFMLPAGSFVMGSESDEAERDEQPVKEVAVQSFWLDRTEVVQQDYAAVMGENPSHFNRCPLCPVEKVSWSRAKKYCKKVGKRLPTEAEWEYAAGAGSEEDYAWGDEPDGLYAWSERNGGNKTHPVATAQPNDWGLHDMAGNVREWVADWYEKGKYRTVKGGSFYYHERNGRHANREGFLPKESAKDLGFRCARDAH